MKKEKAINNFLEDENLLDENEDQKEKKADKKMIRERTGLIERIDKVFVTKDGRQLLRERY